MNEIATKCMSCQKQESLKEIFDLGNPYLSDFVKASDTHKCTRFPLKLMFCTNCGLGQLEKAAPQDWSFRNYWYRSSVTETMRNLLRDIALTGVKLADLRDGDAVLDIGANDGTLLRSYPSNLLRVGFEPARNLTDLATEGGNTIVPEYFTATGINAGRFKVITSVSMFYDVPDPLQFLKDVRHCLAPDGVFILQINYAGSMFTDNAFDNIGHEHLGYYTFTVLSRLLLEAGLTTFHVERNNINGGSIQLHCKKYLTNRLQETHNPLLWVDETPGQLLREEAENGLTSVDKWLTLKDNIGSIEICVRAQVNKWVSENKKIYLLGASTRASTFMQYFGLDGMLVHGASERDPRKIGLVTSGTWLPIVSEEQARQEADCFIIGPWAFKNEIVGREATFLIHDKEILFPMPVPTLITRHGERAL